MRALVIVALLAAGCSHSESELATESPWLPQPQPRTSLPDDGSASIPSITSIEPRTGTVGEMVRIVGTGFGTNPGQARIDGVVADVMAWTDTSVELRVPDVFPGSRDLVLEMDQGTMSALFRVSLPPVAFVNEDRVAENVISALRLPVDRPPELMPSSPFATGAAAAGFGGDAHSIALHAATRRVFATNEDSVAVFDVDGATGALRPVPGSPFAAGATRCFGIAVSPDGSRVFVASYANSSVAVLAVDAGGALSPLPGSPFALAAGGGPDSLQLTPDGRFLYVNLEDLQAMDVLAVAADGSLSRIEGAPFPYAGGSFVYSIRLDPQGRFAYVPDSAQERIAVYRLDPSTGVPAEIAGSPFAAAGMVHGLAFAPDSRRVFATTDDPQARIHVFEAGDDGSLTAIDGSPFASGLTDTSSVEVSADGARLYILDEASNRLGLYGITDSGAPEALATVTIDLADGQPSGIVLTH